MHNPRQAVIDAKAALLARMPDVAPRMRRLDEWLADEVAAVKAEGADAVPQLAYRDVCNGAVSAAERLRIRRRGCVIIRNVFDAPQATEWNAAIGRYIDDNDYYRKAHDKAGLDQYFSALQSGRPQIFGLYWSLPQMQARQHENLNVTRRWLNRLCDFHRPRPRDRPVNVGATTNGLAGVVKLKWIGLTVGIKPLLCLEDSVEAF